MRPVQWTGWLVLAILAAAITHAQNASALRFVSPMPDSYASGQTLLRVAHDGAGGAAAVVDVTFFADGLQVCVAAAPRLECEWNAGRVVEAHALRAVARLKDGGRVIANVRTKALEFAQAVAVDIVQINTVVTSGGRFVKGLTRDAFRVFDDKDERPIVGFEPAGAPLEVVLALDVSASMEGALSEMRRAAQGFLKALDATHRVTIVAFNDEVFTLANRDTSAATRLQALDKLSAWGGTALFDVIVESIQMVSQHPGRRAVIVFSDGEDRTSTSTFGEVQRLVEENDATIFTIGLGRGVKTKALQTTLEAVASASGGLALFADDPDELAESFAEIVENLANQYTLGFEPRRDGKHHELRVQVPGRGFRVRARRGYVAPAP
jgi:Ca-activated chloride channel family protein